MNTTKGIFSCKSDEWTTPNTLFMELNSEFGFTLDPCSTDDNHLCTHYYTKDQDGLRYSWAGEIVFCNPPYSKCKDWIRKSYEESKNESTIIVCLVPARTDTKWFHDYVLYNAEIRFIRGRLRFSNSKENAPFPSMIVIFRSKETKSRRFKNGKEKHHDNCRYGTA